MTDSSNRGSAVKTGDIVEGRYRIIETLGEGSMGAVFLAEHVLLKRRVALKLLRSALSDDAAVLDGFMTEVRGAGTLGHPHIVECIDVGLTRANVAYVVLEYLEGALLTDEIYRVGGLPVRRALKIADQIASALSAAHDAGIVHRDLKSDSVFLIDKDDAFDVVKVLDFGIGRFLEAPGDHNRRGLVLGSAEFMAPEQVTSPGTADRRADVYALGVILYEMLTARRPFSDDDRRALLHRVVNEPPPPLMRPEAPAGLEEMIAGKLLAKDPARRYPSMKEVRSALEAFATIMRPSGPAPGPRAAVRRAGDPIGPLGPVAPLGPLAQTDTAPPELSSELVRLPALPERRSSRRAWLVAAMLVGGAGGGLLYVEEQTATASDAATSATLDGDAEKLASLLDSEVRAAHLRAEGVATMPMLRAAIETDAATLKDMVGSDFIFSPKPGEVLELFQLHGGGAPASILRIPDRAPPLSPIVGNQTRIESDGTRITVVVGAPVAKQTAGIGGSVAISVPIDLSPLKRRLAEHARSATLIGVGAPVPLFGVAGPGEASIAVPVQLSPDLGIGGVSLAAAIAPVPGDLRRKLRIARVSCWGGGGVLLALYLASLLRGRKRA